jgi:hypothetical protein
MRRFSHHVYHASHHNFTTKTPQKHHVLPSTFPKTPQKTPIKRERKPRNPPELFCTKTWSALVDDFRTFQVPEVPNMLLLGITLDPQQPIEVAENPVNEMVRGLILP